MVAIYAIVSVSVSLAAGIALLPAMGWWGILAAWCAANVAGIGLAIVVDATRRRKDAVTDRMVSDLRSVLTAAEPPSPSADIIPQVDRRVA